MFISLNHSDEMRHFFCGFNDMHAILCSKLMKTCETIFDFSDRCSFVNLHLIPAQNVPDQNIA